MKKILFLLGLLLIIGCNNTTKQPEKTTEKPKDKSQRYFTLERVEAVSYTHLDVYKRQAVLFFTCPIMKVLCVLPM